MSTKKRGFSLIELLIVVMLIGIVYGIYFFTIVESKKPIPFSLETMKKYLKNASKTYGDKLQLIYYFDEKKVYLINSKKELLESIDFEQELTVYQLKQDERIEIKVYKEIEIDDNTFEPTFIYSKTSKEIYDDLIINNENNQWYYFNTYFGNDFEKFINQSDLVSFIKKTQYLPMYAGDPE